MITIYHNNRCRKSREGLELVKSSGKDFEIREYLNDIPTKAELTELIAKLGITPMDLVRTGEAIWKDQFKGKNLSEDELIQAMTDYPKLIERPIVISGTKAVIGRPPEKILDIL